MLSRRIVFDKRREEIEHLQAAREGLITDMRQENHSCPEKLPVPKLGHACPVSTRAASSSVQAAACGCSGALQLRETGPFASGKSAAAALQVKEESQHLNGTPKCQAARHRPQDPQDVSCINLFPTSPKTAFAHLCFDSRHVSPPLTGLIEALLVSFLLRSAPTSQHGLASFR